MRPRDISTGKALLDGSSLLHTSHRCHVDSCLQPDHLTIETPFLNRSRKKCLANRICVGESHEDCKCIVTDVDWSLIHQLVKKKRDPMTNEQRMSSLADAAPAVDDFDVDYLRLIALLNDKATRNRTVRQFIAGEAMDID